MLKLMKGGITMSLLGNWEQWKGFLGDRLNQAKQNGMDDSTVNRMAQHVGDYLAEHVDPKNEQQRVLSDLWSVANEQEQQAIAEAMVRMVSNNGTDQQ